MRSNSRIFILSLFAFITCSTALAQRQAYVATRPRVGEEEAKYYLFYLDASGSRMVDTLWLLDPAFSPTPDYPVTNPAKVLALFHDGEPQHVQVPAQSMAKDSLTFRSGRFVSEMHNWVEFTFLGKRRGGRIQGKLIQRFFTEALNSIDTDTCRVTFNKVAAANR